MTKELASNGRDSVIKLGTVLELSEISKKVCMKGTDSTLHNPVKAADSQFNVHILRVSMYVPALHCLWMSFHHG